MEGYDTFHKTVVLGFWFIVFVALMRAVLMLFGGHYTISYQQTVPASTEVLWPWITENKNRARWQAYITDYILMNGDVETENSTRMVFWKEGFTRRSALEATREAVKFTRFSTLQDSEVDTRILTVELVPIDACATTVKITEVIQPKPFSDRFWSFLYRGEKTERLKISLNALDLWMYERGGCKGVTIVPD